MLDVFAGTGAFGLEALSRGAAEVGLIDADTRSLMKNTALFPAEKSRIKIYRHDVLALPQAPEAYDLLFMDAPYNRGLSAPALQALAEKGWLKPGALCLVEVEKAEQLQVPACYIFSKRAYIWIGKGHIFGIRPRGE